MTWFGGRRVPLCACLAALLFLLWNGSESPSNATTTDGTDAARDQAPRGDVKAPAKTAVPNEAAAVKAASPAGGVKLSGRVLFHGTPPARRVVNMGKDAKCVEIHGGKPVLDEELIVNSDGGVKNAFVRVQGGAPKLNYPMPEGAAMLNQKDCMFRPRVQGVRVGQRLLVSNGDPMTHNVRSFPILNSAFNFGQPPDTDPRERVFDKAEREIEIQCDFHLWMHAFIFVMDHPFFSVSQDDGMFSIDGLPPGKYTLESWHERLGKQRKTVTVGDKDLTDVNFAFPR